MTLTFAQSQDGVAKLVKHFSTNRTAFLASTYKEAQARQELIDPLFVALGWDVRNEGRAAPQYREVIVEPPQDVEGKRKAPDYAFRVGRDTVFYAEAKKPSVAIKDEPTHAYQLRRYAWSAKLPLSVLTDFHELAVYDCRMRPKESDKVSVGRVNYYTFEEYPDVWREVWDRFSREAVLNGSFDQFAQATKGKRGTSEVDAEFLREIEGWRDALARNLALRNRGLSVEDLNDAVQRTIDRIIFLRMAEDRGMEDYERLRRLADRKRVYPALIDLCHTADRKYNSGLFDFSARGDKLTPKLSIDDKVLKDILAGLYFPQSPYEFSVLPAVILGNVYEQFLGKVIHLTKGHHAKVEDKPEVKKAGGVYYTPDYIVDYIVKNTVGKMIEGKTPSQLKGFRVLDMACGSGSFLLGAYQCLLDHYLRWYSARQRANRASAAWKRAGEWRLTVAEKNRILTSHIFGVDIDRQAVEVTKLSLLLKAVEGETNETLDRQKQVLSLWVERILPNLDGNVKCGNSLISNDYFEGQLLPDAGEMKRVNPFDWDREFPDAMKSGGFDCIIGNPPYVLLQSLDQPAVFRYLALQYQSAKYKIDTYQVFLERAIALTRPAGKVGCITPNTFLRNKHAYALRRLILSSCEVEALRLFYYKVFARASVDTCVIVMSRTTRPDPKHQVAVTLSQSASGPGDVSAVQQHVWNDHPALHFGLPGVQGSDRLILKVDRISTRLGQFATAYFGIQTHGRTEYVRRERESGTFEPVVDGENISRYALSPAREFVDFRPEAIKSGGKRSVYDKERIGVRQIGEVPISAIIPAGTYTLNTVYNVYFTRPVNYALPFVLGILASKLISWYWRQSFYDQKRTFPKVKKDALLSLPIRTIDFSNPADVANHDKMVALVEKMLELHKRLQDAGSAADREVVSRQIAATDAEIDRLVYDLYGLTDEEIRIVEGK